MSLKAIDVWKSLNSYGHHLPNVLLYGPPGTGKTTIAMSAGLTQGQEARRVNFTEDTPAAEVRGHYVPRGQVWDWHDGPVMEAFRCGHRLVADEITRASDDCLSFMLAVLDKLPVTLPSGEVITPHPSFSVWATTNDTPEALPDALADRLTTRIHCDVVNPAALATLPAEHRKLVSTGKGGVTFREMAEFNRQVAAGVPDEVAVQLVWGSRAEEVFFALCGGVVAEAHREEVEA